MAWRMVLLMLLNWISDMKHRKLIRKLQKEKELAQVMCQHEYTYDGKYEKLVYNTLDCDIVTVYKCSCIKCGKVKKSDNRQLLVVECKLDIK